MPHNPPPLLLRVRRQCHTSRIEYLSCGEMETSSSHWTRSDGARWGGAGENGDSATLTDQLERLLSITGIRAGVPGYEIIACAASSPLPALRAAAVATRLAIALRGQNPEQERQFNVLRAELLLGVAGVPWSLDEESLTRCLGDCEILIHCLVGALSDVASTTSDERKREAMERYSRVCSIVFR